MSSSESLSNLVDLDKSDIYDLSIDPYIQELFRHSCDEKFLLEATEVDIPCTTLVSPTLDFQDIDDDIWNNRSIVQGKTLHTKKSGDGLCRTYLSHLARSLKKKHLRFSQLSVLDIVQLLERGAKQSLLPKLADQPVDLNMYISPKRTGRKRGPYKQRFKESWTSFSGTGFTSQTLPCNITQLKQDTGRHWFREKELVVRDIDFEEISSGKNEVRCAVDVFL